MQRRRTMKSIFKLLAVLILLPYAFGGQNVTIKHKVYTTTFSKSKRFPVVVKWWLTKQMLDCRKKMKRTDDFGPDPLLPAYTNLDTDYMHGGFDRGHNCDAADNLCDTVAEHQSFYFSNMCAQTKELNRGIWEHLESYCRALADSLDSTLIWCGSVANKSAKKIGPDSVVVPDYCWKIIYVRKLKKTLAYVFPNSTSLTGDFPNYAVKVDSVEKLTGLKFTRKK